HGVPGERARRAVAEPGLGPLLVEDAEAAARGDPGQQTASGVRAELEQGHQLGHAPSMLGRTFASQITRRLQNYPPPSTGICTFPGPSPFRHGHVMRPPGGPISGAAWAAGTTGAARRPVASPAGPPARRRLSGTTGPGRPARPGARPAGPTSTARGPP